MPTLTTADIKSHLRIYHTQDDSYISTILYPAAVQAVERCTGLSVTAAARSYTVTAEGDQWVALPYQPHNPSLPVQVTYTPEGGSPTTDDADLHWEGNRIAALVPEDAERPVVLSWTTLGADEATNMLVLQLCGRLYADRGDSTGAIEGKAQALMTAMLAERVLA